MLCILPSSWCEAGARNIGFLARVWHHFRGRTPEHYYTELGFELDYYCYLLNRTPFFGGKITPKIKLLLWIHTGYLRQKREFSCFLSSTLRGKNNSLRVERHELLLWISKEQAKSKDHYNINWWKNRTSWIIGNTYSL